MLKLNTHQAKTQLSKLLALVEERDEVVIICRNGRPIAELRRAGRVADPLERHEELAGVVFHRDPMEPLDSEDWPDAFEEP